VGDSIGVLCVGKFEGLSIPFIGKEYHVGESFPDHQDSRHFQQIY
jgi:hypothetical protein